MRLKQEREAAKKRAAEQADAEFMRQHALFVASNEERHARTKIAAGDGNAMVDLLDHVVALHEVGAHQEAESLAERIKASLATADADEAELFVSEKVDAEKRARGKRDPKETEEDFEAILEAFGDEPPAPEPAPKKSKKKS